jgi:hypothetical protein
LFLFQFVQVRNLILHVVVLSFCETKTKLD